MDFDLLKPEHYQRLKPFFAAQSQPLSAYSLASLISWSQCIYDTVFAVAGDAVIIGERRMDDPGRKHLLLPVCPNGPKPPAWLKEQALAGGFKEYHLVPQTYLDGFGAEVEKLFAVTEETEYEDYVYLSAHLAELPGRDYAKKRNLVRQFERDCVDSGRAKAELISQANAGDCLACLEGWRAERGGQQWTGLLECERQAVIRALQNFALFEFQGLMVLIDGQVQGFGIGSRLKDDTWVLHFEKALSRVKGLYQYLDRECARRLFPGVTFLNKESDMGDAGLAKAKLSYSPAFRVKSYRLELR
ncbi:MAG: phosphatidylglycerol lysyltransferase domain-containing protein [Elusimicrobia bacterium]|nr:phosphatidylglycerol lysyltransferase domain-containing protein [Elusimicrobiota bacterium]